MQRALAPSASAQVASGCRQAVRSSAAPTPAARRTHRHARHAAAAAMPQQQQDAAAALAAAPPPRDTAAVEAQIRQLERAAMEAHGAAQQLNNCGRFEEAKVKYDLMRSLDAQALQLTNSLGCPSCRKDTAGGADTNAAAPAAAGAAAAAEYVELQRVTPWPAGSGGNGGGAEAVAARARGAVLGCAVGDAAAMGVQWIYDLDKLGALLAARRAAEGAGAGLEFYEPPQSPFLPGYESGRLSPYGEGTMVLLRSLARERGFHARAYAALHYETFGEGFEGYRNASTTGFLRNHGRGLAPPASGAEDAQADCVARLAPLVAAFAGHPSLMRIVAAATRTTQNTDDAEAWACAGAAVLERLILEGCSVAQALTATVAELRGGSDRLPASDANAIIAAEFQRVLDLAAAPHGEAVAALGRNCHLPNSACTPLHCALAFEAAAAGGGGEGVTSSGGSATSSGGVTGTTGDALFAAAIREALAAGGCCASRAGFAGALLGAALGPGGVPAAWAARAAVAGEVATCFEAIDAARRDAV